jgi:hypothetical protein
MFNSKTLIQQTRIDSAVTAAQSLPDLIGKLEAIDPVLASQLSGKALLASRTPWGVLASGIVGWIVAHYGLGLDEATTNSIAGLFVLIGSFAMRYITRTPITSITIPSKVTT